MHVALPKLCIMFSFYQTLLYQTPFSKSLQLVLHFIGVPLHSFLILFKLRHSRKLSCCQGLMSRFTHGHVCISYLQMCTIITICFQNMNRHLSYRQSNLQVQAPWVWYNIMFPFLEMNILAASKSKCNLYASRLNQSRTSL